VGSSCFALRPAAGGTWRASDLELRVAGAWTREAVIQPAAGAVAIPLTIHAAPP
jgi:hypothetical protein